MQRLCVWAFAVLLVAAATDVCGQEKQKRQEFEGKWTGPWENTMGGSGTETLVLKETPEGLLSGVYWEDSKLKGERVGDGIFHFEARTSTTRYNVVGRVASGKLHIHYAATVLDGGKRYYGRSVLEKVSK